MHSPQVVFRVKVTYDSRNDLAFTMGVADKPLCHDADRHAQIGHRGQSGRRPPHAGEYSDDNSIELAFDFTEAVPKYASYTEPKYFLTVTRSEIGKAGSGVINAFFGDRLPGRRRPEGSMSATFRNQSCWKRARISSRPPRPPLKKPPRRRPYNGSTTSGPPYTAPYVLRTASGKYAKFEVTDYDRGCGPGDDQVSLSGRRQPQPEQFNGLTTMKTMKHSILLLAMTGCAILAGCASDGSGDKGPAPEPAQVKTLSVEGLSDDRWVYISLETGSKVGESPLGDAAQDAAWKARTDWDIALCGELIRPTAERRATAREPFSGSRTRVSTHSTRRPPMVTRPTRTT